MDSASCHTLVLPGYFKVHVLTRTREQYTTVRVRVRVLVRCRLAPCDRKTQTDRMSPPRAVRAGRAIARSMGCHA